MIIDWTTLDADNADLQTKKMPSVTVRNLQRAVKILLKIGEVETATAIFETIKLYFKGDEKNVRLCRC